MAAILDLRTQRFGLFLYLQCTLILPNKLQVNWPFGSGEEAQNRFQDGGRGSHLGFPIRMIFSLQVAPLLPTRFWINRP